MPADEPGARSFVETHFRVESVESRAGDSQGLFTGYYEPELRGSLVRRDLYQTPLYAKPAVSGPYPSRAAIDTGALAGQAEVLAFADDPVAAFFMQVQGSGRVKLVDGRTLSLTYAGSNDQPYTAIGKTLVAHGAIAQSDVNAMTIAAWLRQHPDKARSVMETNARYVFFRIGAAEGPVGAAGRRLVAGISLAVDPAAVPLGSLVWLALDPAAGEVTPRLMLADDKGIAIRGAVRGDIYFGSGDAAGTRAGLLKASGRYWILVPRG